jgi:hypothetical protein
LLGHSYLECHSLEHCLLGHGREGVLTVD